MTLQVAVGRLNAHNTDYAVPIVFLVGVRNFIEDLAKGAVRA
ncbi:hypothetical protein [Lentzea sp. NPDC004782]